MIEHVHRTDSLNMKLIRFRLAANRFPATGAVVEWVASVKMHEEGTVRKRTIAIHIHTQTLHATAIFAYIGECYMPWRSRECLGYTRSV